MPSEDVGDVHIWKNFFDDKNFFSRISNFATEIFEARTDHSSIFVKLKNFVEKLRVFKNTSSSPPPKKMCTQHVCLEFRSLLEKVQIGVVISEIQLPIFRSEK